MRFCAGLSMTKGELDLVKDLEENAMKHITFVNDICSFEKEVRAAENGYELGAVCSSVPIVMDMYKVGEQEAKDIMWNSVRDWEGEHFKLVDDILRRRWSPELVIYCKGLEHQIAGNEAWSLMTPRYNKVKVMPFTARR